MLDSHHWQWRVSGSSTCCLKSYVTSTHPRWRLSKRDWMNTSVRYRISQLYQIVAEQLPATVCFTSFRCWEPSDRIESNNTLTRQDKWSVSVSRCSKVCSWHYCLQFEMEKRCEWIHLLDPVLMPGCSSRSSWGLWSSQDLPYGLTSPMESLEDRNPQKFHTKELKN